MHAIIHPADLQDRDGSLLLLFTLLGLFASPAKVFADGGYLGPRIEPGAAKLLTTMRVEIVKRADAAKGFVFLPRRWVVERTLAWLDRCRCLAKDFENRTRNPLAFLKLASICLMLRKLCNC